MTEAEIERLKTVLLDKQAKIRELENQQTALEYETYDETQSLWKQPDDSGLNIFNATAAIAAEDAVKEWIFDFLYNNSISVEKLLGRLT